FATKSLSIIMFGDGLEATMKTHKAWRMGKVLARLRPAALTAVQLAATALASQTVHAAGAGGVANLIREPLQGFQQLLLLIAMALLGAGIAIKFLPLGSHRTKEGAGQLIDSALIVGGLTALGLYIIKFAADVAVAASGQGSSIPIGGPWDVPS
ncbi:MAG: hypothetical protein QXD61_02670, partial [Candidatus Caldarchaeum sp.]